MDQWKQSAEILNTYFHETCHGEIPFYMDWTNKAQKVGGFDSQALEYLDHLKLSLKFRGTIVLNKATPPLCTR
jgi:hypothetical protein